MTPDGLIYEEGGISLHRQDCRDVDLPPNSIDLLFTDPPYGQQLRLFGSKDANVRADGARQGCRIVRQALLHFEPAMKPGSHLLTMCHWESWPDFYDSIAPLFSIKNALIWHKNRGGMGDLEVEYARDYEVILYAVKIGARRPLIGKRPCAVLSGFPPVGNERLHPTEKPIALARSLIARHCPVGGTVLDPFVGSGTTLVAASDEGRNAIGVEIDPVFCEKTVERLRQRSLALSL